MKRLLSYASGVVLCLTPGPSVAIPTKPYTHNEAAIVRVFCLLANGGASVGTAVKIGPDLYVTAAHVVDEGVCTADSSPITEVRTNTDLDFATFRGAIGPAQMIVSCSGYRAGRIYIARGFGGGGYANFELPWIATEAAYGKQTVFVGEALAGMSGGPVIDRNGTIAGIVNTRLAASSLPLSQTWVCP